MKKILFTIVIISSLSQAMSPEKWFVKRRNGGKLTSEQIQKITLIDNARGCPETNWIEILKEKEKKICLDKLNTDQALLIILTHPQQIELLKKIPGLQASLFAKEKKTNLFLVLLEKLKI